jgi:hypothetical protein
VRRLKANWFAAPTVATVTRCRSSSTAVNCTHRQERSGRVQSSAQQVNQNFCDFGFAGTERHVP